MKQLKFTHIEAENIKRGIQTATLRMKDEKEISVDDVLEIVAWLFQQDLLEFVDKVLWVDHASSIHTGSFSVKFNYHFV